MSAPNDYRDPLDRITRPEGSAVPKQQSSDDKSVSDQPEVIQKAAEQFGLLQRALTIEEDDPWYVGGVKILAMILTGILLLGLSPLIILGLVVGLAAAA